ncbi:MAG: hypothetical protein E6I91_01190 [Chloroflexi bacterium]|nr:MAG: hypothetical protein E6I91_01190 [Chloroflexota bacterium]
MRFQTVVPGAASIGKPGRFPVGAGVDDARGRDACVALVLVPQVFPFLPGRRKRPLPASTPLPPLRNTPALPRFSRPFLLT